jgi:hypothetical protein
MSRSFKVVIVALVVLIGGGSLSVLHLQNAQTRERLGQLRARQHEAERLREENVQLQHVIAQSAANTDAAARVFHEELVQARATLAELEAKASARHAQMTAQAARDTAALDANRDPTTGLVRLEHFRNVGQATASDAFQTMVWATYTGDDAAFANVCVLSKETRARAEALIQRLPEESRASWTPEKLAQLWVTGVTLELSAAQIVGEQLEDPEHMAVSVRGTRSDQTGKFKFIRAPSGWKAVIPPKAIDMVEKKIQAR